MHPEGPLPCKQIPATDPYESNPHPQTIFPKIHFNIILPSTSRSYEWVFPSGFPIKNLYVLSLKYSLGWILQSSLKK
jgi:hypothetical protein